MSSHTLCCCACLLVEASPESRRLQVCVRGREGGQRFTSAEPARVQQPPPLRGCQHCLVSVGGAGALHRRPARGCPGRPCPPFLLLGAGNAASGHPRGGLASHLMPVVGSPGVTTLGGGVLPSPYLSTPVVTTHQQRLDHRVSPTARWLGITQGLVSVQKWPSQNQGRVLCPITPRTAGLQP